MGDRNVAQWFAAFIPAPVTVARREIALGTLGALLGLGCAAWLSQHMLAGLNPWFIAPMGASAVLLFAVPSSPLAQPWSLIGGNLVAALIGVTCAKWVSDIALASALAGALAIAAMFSLRCLHPPSGAVALTAVLGGPAIHAAGFKFAFLPVCLNSTLIVLAALVFNNLTGRRYPHNQKSALRTAQQAAHATRDPSPMARLGFTAEDLDAVLARYGQVLDVSRDDLEDILLQTEQRAYARRFGTVTCGAIMSKDVVTATPDMPLAEAWRLLRHHNLHALPVLDASHRVAGIVGQGDFLHHAGLDDYQTVAERLRSLFTHLLGVRPDRAAKVGELMSTRVAVVSIEAS